MVKKKKTWVTSFLTTLFQPMDQGANELTDCDCFHFLWHWFFTYCDAYISSLWQWFISQTDVQANKLLLPLSQHLWHRFLYIVIFSFLCDNSFYRLINRMAQRQTHYVSLHLTYCDICCYPLWHWFLHLVTFFSIVTIVFTNNEISCLSLWQSI